MFAGRAGEGRRSGEILPAPQRVIAAEIHCFTNFRHRVNNGFAGFAHRHRHQNRHVPLHEIFRFEQAFGPCVRVGCVPNRGRTMRARNRRLHLLCVGVIHDPGFSPAIGRVGHHTLTSILVRHASNQGRGAPDRRTGGAHGVGERIEHLGIGEVDAQ